jgi:hypothetical protein
LNARIVVASVCGGDVTGAAECPAWEFPAEASKPARRSTVLKSSVPEVPEML